jgi:hypothetical protein
VKVCRCRKVCVKKERGLRVKGFRRPEETGNKTQRLGMGTTGREPKRGGRPQQSSSRPRDAEGRGGSGLMLD